METNDLPTNGSPTKSDATRVRLTVLAADALERWGLGRFAFEFATFSHKVVNIIAMADPCNRLCDNRTFVQIFCRIVRCCTDKFYTTFVRAVIWLCPTTSSKVLERHLRYRA